MVSILVPINYYYIIVDRPVRTDIIVNSINRTFNLQNFHYFNFKVPKYFKYSLLDFLKQTIIVVFFINLSKSQLFILLISFLEIYAQHYFLFKDFFCYIMPPNCPL